MSAIRDTAGGGLVVLGAFLGLQAIGQGLIDLNTNKYQGTTAQRVAKVVAELFIAVGSFCGAIAMIISGVMVFNIQPSDAFLPVFRQALEESIPWLIGAAASVGSGVVIREIAR